MAASSYVPPAGYKNGGFDFLKTAVLYYDRYAEYTR
jgi:hypothetical protein